MMLCQRGDDSRGESCRFKRRAIEGGVAKISNPATSPPEESSGVEAIRRVRKSNDTVIMQEPYEASRRYAVDAASRDGQPIDLVADGLFAARGMLPSYITSTTSTTAATTRHRWMEHLVTAHHSVFSR